MYLEKNHTLIGLNKLLHNTKSNLWICYAESFSKKSCVNILKPSCEPVKFRNFEKSLFFLFQSVTDRVKIKGESGKTHPSSTPIKLLVRTLQLNFFGLFASLYVPPTHSSPLPDCPPTSHPGSSLIVFLEVRDNTVTCLGFGFFFFLVLSSLRISGLSALIQTFIY